VPFFLREYQGHKDVEVVTREWHDYWVGLLEQRLAEAVAQRDVYFSPSTWVDPNA